MSTTRPVEDGAAVEDEGDLVDIEALDVVVEGMRVVGGVNRRVSHTFPVA